MKIKSLRHIGVVSKKIDKSIEFYKKFGFEVYWDEEETGEFIDTILGEKIKKLRTVKLRNENFAIELLEFKETPHEDIAFKIYSNSITHIAVNFENIDEFYKSNYNLFLGKPSVTKNKNAKVGFIKDPYNNVFLELVEVKKWS